jgi:hypothetical protein
VLVPIHRSNPQGSLRHSAGVAILHLATDAEMKRSFGTSRERFLATNQPQRATVAKVVGWVRTLLSSIGSR